MGALETFAERNARFSETKFDPSLQMKPKLATIVICCADTRVDPAVVLGAEQGEIMAIRNIGGRICSRPTSTAATPRSTRCQPATHT